MSGDLGDVAKGGGFVAAVAGLLLALRHYIPRRRNGNGSQSINQAIEDRVKQELNNAKTLREVFAEQRDDRMMECLTRMEHFQQKCAEDNFKMLSNMRDILRDIAIHRGLSVRYYDKD